LSPSAVRDLAKIRGWLLVFAVILIPHGVGSLFVLLSPEFRGAESALGLGTLVVTAAGNLSGIVLILSRNRLAPAFFTLYPPLLLLLNLLHPDLLATANARLAALGSTDEFGPTQLGLVLAVNVALVVLMVGYWARSERVQAVFGTKGLQRLWNPPS
jgi:hypothetical protein